MSVTASPEYQRIAAVYGDQVAQRSGQRLMRHIDHGLLILDAIGASDVAKRAFCVHPLVQDDAAFSTHLHALEGLDPVAIAIAVEYRAVANAYLSQHRSRPSSSIALGPLPEVAWMLVADKVQNRHDFQLFHRATHPNAARLGEYFDEWLQRLGVDDAQLAMLTSLLIDAAATGHDAR